MSKLITFLLSLLRAFSTQMRIENCVRNLVRRFSHACNPRSSATLSKIEMAIEIDWPGIRAAAVAIGVRETARRAAALLPPAEQKRFVARVLKRSEREGWIVEKKKAIADKELANQQAKPLSSAVANGAKAIGDAVLEHSHATRIALAKATRNGAEHLQEQSGAFIVRKSKNVRDLTAAAAQVGGWDQGKSAGVQFKLLQIGGTLTLVSEGQGSGNETLAE